MTAIRMAVSGAPGFFGELAFSPQELNEVREMIREQWLDRITNVHPKLRECFELLPMDRYHEYAHLVDHKRLWPKIERILPADSVKRIRGTGLLRLLEREFGDFVISGEEGTGREEIYWRLVRPDNLSDVGPIHADAWFWELGHGATPSDVTRVKVWIAIYCDTGRNGFRMVSHSHKRDWPYHGEVRDGIIKPVIDVSESQLHIEIFASKPGQAIVFNDKLLHGGAPGGITTRVSMEFTMLVKTEWYAK